MDITSSVVSNSSSRSVHSCIRCAERKVKCDRQDPCGACTKHGSTCIFRPVLQKSQRRNKELLKARLKHYEALLREQGFDPGELPDTAESEQQLGLGCLKAATTGSSSQPPTHASTTSKYERSTSDTRVIHAEGRSKFIDNSLWSRVAQELHDPDDPLENLPDDASEAEASEENFAFVLGLVAHTTECLHPPPEHSYKLWRIFVENVDPLTKVVHVPSMRHAMRKAAANVNQVPRGFEPVMFAIYTAAVISLKDDQCREAFGEARKMLLSRYMSATKAALARANFMSTTSLIVLQALVLHLISARDIHEPRTVWTLSGVALRIAENMGLHRDGTFLKLPSFESEIRRRVWWQLKMNDYRAAELSGHDKFRGAITGTDAPRQPTNIDDEHLYPGMTSLTESTRLTDMVFCNLRFEIINVATTSAAKLLQQGRGAAQDVRATASEAKEIDEFMDRIEEMIEKKYLQYCDPSQSLHLMAMLAARSAMNVGRLHAHHPRRWTSETTEAERRHVWRVSIQLLEQYEMVQSNRHLKGYAWYATYFFQWHALIHVLDTLRAEPLIQDAVKTWQLVESVYEYTPDMIWNTKKPIHVAVGNLCLKAFDAREAALSGKETHISATPRFVSELREQRQQAKLRRAPKVAKYKQAGAGTISSQVNTKPVQDDLLPQEHGELHTTQLDTFSQAVTPDFPNDCSSDNYWFTSGIDTGFGSLDDSVDMNADFMLDHSLEDAIGHNESIDWTYWDAWLNGSSKSGDFSGRGFEDSAWLHR